MAFLQIEYKPFINTSFDQFSKLLDEAENPYKIKFIDHLGGLFSEGIPERNVYLGERKSSLNLVKTIKTLISYKVLRVSLEINTKDLEEKFKNYIKE